MRLNTAFSRLLRFWGVWVGGVRFEPDRVIVRVALRRRRLVCPECSFSTPHRHDVRPVLSDWRHLDLGVWRLEIRAQLRRLSCPVHGVRTEGVPFARAGSDFTRDFERLVAYLDRQEHDLPAGANQLAHRRADHRARQPRRA